MRKNYFAKKFVAYSMAFAVAFSTLTVSPVFVKEAKAVTFATPIGTGGGTTVNSAATFNATEGNYFLNTLTKDSVTGITTDPTYSQLQEILGESNDVLFKDATLTEVQNSKGTLTGNDNASKYVLTVTTSAATTQLGMIDGVATPTSEQIKYDVAAEDPGEVADDASETIASGTSTVKVVARDKAVVLDGTQNKNVTLTAADTAKNAKLVWYKLDKVNKTFDWANSQGGTSKLTFDGFKLVEVQTFDGSGSNDDTKAAYTFPSKVTEDDLGLYMCIDQTSNQLLSFVNLYQKSDLKISTVKENVYAVEGTKVTLSVNVDKGTAKSYTWKKGTKTLENNTNTLEISEMSSEDVAKYTCTVSDDVTEKDVKINVDILDATVMGAEATATVLQTTKKVLTDTGRFNNDKITLTTNLPDGDYYYIWDAAATALLSTTDAINYNPANKTITLNSGAAAPGTITCYAVPKSAYEKATNVAAALEAISKTTNDADKYKEITKNVPGSLGLLAAEQADLITGTKYVYSEVITLKKANETLASDGTTTLVPDQDATVDIESEVKAVKIGEKVTLTAPTVPGLVTRYVWTNAAGDPYNCSSNELVIENVDQTDLGAINCTVKVCNDSTACTKVEDHTAPGTHYTREFSKTFNLLYSSDLKASGKDVEVRNGQDVELSVTASSSIAPKYEWRAATETVTTGAIAEGTLQHDVNKGLATQKILKVGTAGNARNGKFYDVDATPTRDLYICKVTDGINTITVPVKILPVETFKVYENKQMYNKGHEAGKTYPGVGPIPTTFDVTGLKGDKIVLAPYVVSSEAIASEITYTWKKDGINCSTDKALEVECGDTNVTYTVTITEGTNPITLTYNVKTAKEEDLQGTQITNADIDFDYSNVYTGKEINPINSVVVKVTVGGDQCKYTLKSGVDYKVELIDAINAGISQFKVVCLGNFEKAYNKLTVVQKQKLFEGTFAITRADNKVEIADSTVMVGKSVQPKTVTNLGKGALTYTYYADADCATEIAAPTKVGTYYVKATANATMNYNEAESNVAKIVVAPATTKVTKVATNASAVKLTWTKVAGATKYRVFVKKSGKWDRVADTSSLTYTVKKLASATKYEFAVRAYAGSIASPKYVTKTAYTTPAKVATPAVKAGSKKATVSFKKVARATGYEIYMAKGNGKYVKVKTTTTNSFTKTGLTKGATYKFKVRAYKKVGSKVYYGAFSTVKAVKVK